MRGSQRIAPGLLTDGSRRIEFIFDGRRLVGIAGDTLASALLANGRRLIGRSFKYHRPRGIQTGGPEEPSALVDLITERGREPNRLATTVELHEGLIAHSQNRWPSLKFDVLGANAHLSRFLPAGFYYKTFMAPGWAWEKLYEPLIRRAAGLGKLQAQVPEHADPAETVHDHADVLIVGAGAAGLAAAIQLESSQLRVLLVEQDVLVGGGLLLDSQAQSARTGACARLASMANVRTLTRTCVLGAYGHGVFAALENLSFEQSAQWGGLRERLRIIRARSVILATGAIERLIAFSGNDVPGVMLAGAALSYLRRYGVAVGAHPAFFCNNDEAYEAAFALQLAGVACAGIIDPRPTSRAAERARALGISVHSGAVVYAARGGQRLRSVSLRRLDGAALGEIKADALLVSGGHSPAASLATQLGVALKWQPDIAAFAVAQQLSAVRCAGAVSGDFGIAAAARAGAAAARELAAELGSPVGPSSSAFSVPADVERTPLSALWEVPGPGKAFVDLQNDVTTDDVRLAAREGYAHIEHMKRYTTHSMATDQGRIGALVGSAVLAQARGIDVAEVGLPRARPYGQPVPFAALAGAEVREHFKPKRRLPLHEWHAAAGATFVNAGLWLRPLVYSREPGWACVLREARAVRQAVGITDVSTLGKIDVQGPDAARFLDFIYANTFSTLAVGRARYGIMLREDGMLFDDGTTTRLAQQHFVVTTTTANTTAVLEHLEFHLQSSCAAFDVVVSDVTDEWAQFALAGPRAREVLASVAQGVDLSNAAFPFMAAAAGQFAGVSGRVFRISFSGECAYEIAVPARQASIVWQALLDAGRPLGLIPYGLDALNTLRIEKGHITTAELNGNTSPCDLGFERLLKKHGDFIGRTLSERPAMQAADRLQLVGVRPLDAARRLRNGAHLTERGAAACSLGYVTSCTPATQLAGWVGLALLSAGRARIGTQLLSVSPVHHETLEVKIVSPHMVDPENLRVRA